MLDKNTIIRVTNRSYGTVGYQVPDLGIRREYQSNETKEVTFEELLKLSYMPGGRKMILKYLVMDNEEAIAEILGEVEPEYFYTKDDVIELLQKGSLAQLEDCLDFASGGVIDLVKKLAVDLRINDISKRKAILDKTGFSVDAAIAVVDASTEEEEQKETTVKRRTAPLKGKSTEAEGKTRRVNPPKYKVTSIKE